MKEAVYEVVWPLGKSAYQTIPLKPRVSDLKGKTICELSHRGFRDDEVFPLLRELLPKRYPGVKCVDHTVFGNIHGTKEAEVIASLPTLLHKHGCDAVISGIGG
jgi:hypothetical protein